MLSFFLKRMGQVLAMMVVNADQVRLPIGNLTLALPVIEKLPQRLISTNIPPKKTIT